VGSRKIRREFGPGDETQRITTLAFSPDGRLLAAAGHGSHIGLWRPDDGTFLARLPLPRRSSYHGGIGCVTFSPDGKLLAAAGWDETIRGWEMATGQIVFRFQAAPITGQSLAFSADGGRLASGHCDSTVLIWTLNPLEQTAPSRETKLSAREMEQLWSDLCQRDPRSGYGALWHLVHLMEYHLREPGEQLYERDAGVALVKIGPLWSVTWNTQQRFAIQVLKVPLIQSRSFQWHGWPPQPAPSLIKKG